MNVLSRLQAALDDHRAGRLSQAISGYDDVLRHDRSNATAEAMLGVAMAQMGKPRDGLPRLLRAAALTPDAPELLENIAAVLEQIGMRAAASSLLMRSAALSLGSGKSLAAAGACFVATKAAPRALRCLRRALALSPSEAGWWIATGDGALDVRQPETAAACFRRALALGGDRVEVTIRLTDALIRADQVEQAAAILDEDASRVRASRWHRPDLLAHAGMASGSDSFRITSEPKLRHDVQQFEYLMARHLLPPSFDEAVRRYRVLLEQSAGRAINGPCYTMTESERRSVDDTYNRIVHLRRSAFSGPEVLGAGVDWKAAERRYFESKAGILVIDGLLSPEALAEVRRVCLESTIWFDDRHLGGYLGAMLRDGFCDPLLLRISRELGKRMPAVFRDQPLREMWAYKYDSRLDGTALHADSAAVNVNFWITPDEASLSKDRGGLVVFDKRAPAEWEFEKYNNDQPAIRQFLASNDAKDVVVPYRCNRAAIFHSDLFHRTDDLTFRDDYASRRINITMLFGERGS